MASILESELAKTIHSAFKAANLFLAATLTRETAAAATDPADPPPPSSVNYACLAIEDAWALGLLTNALVRSSDVRVLILAQSLPVEPLPRDKITIRNRTYTIVPASTGGLRPIESDPARATWSCRCE